MCNSETNTNNRCMAEILTVINILQQNAECTGDCCLDTCDKGFLGCNATTYHCNTRPVMLYTCCANGTAWSMPTSKDPSVNTTSNVFRVEKIDGNCATFRVLATNPDTDAAILNPYIATNSFFTMSLDCLCVLRCLQDTYVETL